MNLLTVKKLLKEALHELEIEVISDEPDIPEDDIKVILEVAKERILTEMGVDPQEFYAYEESLKDIGKAKGAKKKKELQDALQETENRIMGKLPPQVETLNTEAIRALVDDSIKKIPTPKPQITTKIERIVEKPTTKIIREKEVVREIDEGALDEVKQDIQNIQETIGDVYSVIPEPVDLESFRQVINKDSADTVNKIIGDMPNFRALAMGLEGRISSLENDESTAEVNKIIAGTGITLSPTTGIGTVTITNSGVVTETDPLSLHLNQTTPQTITGGLLSYDVSHPAFTDSHQLVDKEYVDMAVTAINTNFYMLNSASGVSTYKDTQIAIPALAEANVAVSVTANLQEIQGWISPTAGTLSTMIHGIYNMYLEAKVNATAGTKRIKLYWELIERKADNSEVVIATSEDSEELTSTQGDYNIHIALVADYAITAGSRIVGKVRAKLSGLGNNPTVTIYYLGSINSRWEIPTNIEVLSGTFLQLNQTTPQTFTGGTVTGTGLLQVVGGVLGKNVMLTVSDTAPANPQMGDLWVDIS